MGREFRQRGAGRQLLAGIPGLQHPRRLDELTDEEILSCDGVFIPGGHAPMVDLADNPSIGRVLKLQHDADKTIAALCHGPAALLSAPDSDGVWLFDGYKMTAFTNEEEDQTQAGRTGMPWYLEDALKNRGAVFDDGDAAWVSHVVIDWNLVTAQNPGSSEAGADTLLKRLGYEQMSARSVTQEFFDHMEAGEVDDIIGMTAPGAVVSLVPLHAHGSMAEAGASYLRDLARAFPDCWCGYGGCS